MSSVCVLQVCMYLHMFVYMCLCMYVCAFVVEDTLTSDYVTFSNTGHSRIKDKDATTAVLLLMLMIFTPTGIRHQRLLMSSE